MSDPVKGLPEGVEFIDFQQAGPNDFELIFDNGPHIYRGVRLGAAAGVRVKPAEGWTFVQVGFEEIFDIKAYETKQGRPDFKPAKVIPQKTITITATFSVSNQVMLDTLESEITEVPKMPGFVGMKRSDEV